jgi:hypothetical protein
MLVKAVLNPDLVAPRGAFGGANRNDFPILQQRCTASRDLFRQRRDQPKPQTVIDAVRALLRQ